MAEKILFLSSVQLSITKSSLRMQRLFTAPAHDRDFPFAALEPTCMRLRGAWRFSANGEMQMNKLTLALAAAVALGAGSAAMAKSPRPARTGDDAMHRQSATGAKAGEQAYGRALDPAIVHPDDRTISTDPDVRIRTQLQRQPSPADY
jgi:hypothetical protein